MEPSREDRRIEAEIRRIEAQTKLINSKTNPPVFKDPSCVKIIIQALITVILAVPAISFFFDRFVAPAYQLEFTKAQKALIEDQIEMMKRNDSLQDNLEKAENLQERTRDQLSEAQKELEAVRKGLEAAKSKLEELSNTIQNEPNADLQELGRTLESAKTNIESSETAVTSLTESVQEGEVEAQAILNDTQILQEELQGEEAEAEERLDQTINWKKTFRLATDEPSISEYKLRRLV